MIVDLSHYQDPQHIDYAALRSSVSGAYVKLTQSTTYTDVAWRQHHDSLAGLPRGCYHFAGSGSVLGQPELEAAMFATVYQQAPWEMRPTLDIEVGTPNPAWVKTFLKTFRARTGIEQMRVYMPLSYAETFLLPQNWIDQDVDLWIARYNPTLDWDHPSLVMWQYTSEGSVAGITGAVDLSRQMHGWAPAIDGGAEVAEFPQIPDYTKSPPTLLDYAVAVGWATAHAGMAWENTNAILAKLEAIQSQLDSLKPGSP